MFRFDQRDSALEKELSQLKQADYSTQLLETIKLPIPAMVDAQLSTRLEDSIKKSFSSYTIEFKKKAKDERKRYIDLVEKYVKEIIKDEVKNQLLEILPKEVSDYATHVIQSSITESLKNIILAKSSSQPKSTYKAAASLTDSSKGSKSKSKSSGKSAQAEELVFESVNIKMPLNQGEELWNTDNQPNVEAASKDDCKPLPMIENQGRQVVPANYFFNNDLEYLKGGSLSKKYMTSTTKTKVVNYDTIEGIEDMVPSLWSPVKHEVFSTKRIITVTHVKVMKWYNYGYLEEIVVQKEDHQLYKFKEGDFPRLNLGDIEDLLLLLVQKKLSNLEKDVIYHLNVALRMFDITKMTPYTAYNNPLGIIYKDKFKRNRLMSSDELYKFCDGTLTSVRRDLHDITSSLEMDYLPKRRWSKLDRKRSRIMIKAIDQELFERRLMRNLEKFVGGTEYEEDFRLLERTI
ncbi:hypothetical protein Tco_1508562 [Tanacetum coccineum]